MDQLVLAATFFQNGDYKQAALMAQKAFSKLKQRGDFTDAFQALEIRVSAMCATQDYEKAVEVLNGLLREFGPREENQGEVLVKCLLADVLLKKDDTEAALAKAQEAKEKAKDRRDWFGETVALRVLSKIHLHLNNLDEALQFGYRVCDILEEQKDYASQAFELTSLAEIHLQAGQDSECIAAARKAALLFQKAHDIDGEAQALKIGAEASWSSGVIRQSAWHSGDDEGALPMCTRALELFKQSGNTAGQVAMATMQGQLLLQLSEFEEACQVALEATDLVQKTDYTTQQMGDNMKTAIHAFLGRLDARKNTATMKSKKQWSQRAVELSTELVNLYKLCAKTDQSESLYLLGSTLLAKGRALKEKDFAAAVEAAEKSVAAASKAQDPVTEANATVLLAEAHFANQNINSAADVLEKASAIFMEHVNFAGQEKVANLNRQFRFSDQWTKRKMVTSDGQTISVRDAEKTFMPKASTGFKGAKLYIHFDNLSGRAAKNIG